MRSSAIKERGHPAHIVFARTTFQKSKNGWILEQRDWDARVNPVGQELMTKNDHILSSNEKTAGRLIV